MANLPPANAAAADAMLKSAIGTAVVSADMQAAVQGDSSNGGMNNTMTTKDLVDAVRHPRRAYDFFGSNWAISAADSEDDPVASFGLRGFGDMGAVRTSRRTYGFGGLGDITDILNGTTFGIPNWALLAGGAFLAFGGMKMFKGKK